MLSASFDREILGWVTFYLAENMGNTTPNDANLLGEMQCFWATEPVFFMSQMSKLEISWFAVEVLRWLQVRSISSSTTSPYMVLFIGV